MQTNYARGVKVEYRAVQEFRKLGFLAQRTAGSHSPFDIIAVREDQILLVQVKRVQKLIEREIRHLRDQFTTQWASIRLPECVHPILLIWMDRKGWLVSPSTLISSHFCVPRLTISTGTTDRAIKYGKSR